MLLEGNKIKRVKMSKWSHPLIKLKRLENPNIIKNIFKKLDI